MSRVGKKPVVILDKVKAESDGRKVKVTGPLGSLSFDLPLLVGVSVEGKNIVVTRNDDSRDARMRHGMVRAMINNMMHGVSHGFSKSLDIVGIGYKADVQGKNLVLTMGFSHPVLFPVPEGITIKVEKQVRIVVSGASRQQVGEVASMIRKIRPPEPYKGKGIRYVDEIVKRKVGKAAVAAGGAGGGA